MVKKTDPEKPTSKPPPKPQTLLHKLKLLQKGRPVAQQEINPHKIQHLASKGLFYHQHRVTLIELNMKQCQTDNDIKPHVYINKKVEGKVELQGLDEVLKGEKGGRIWELRSMIETALTLKNVGVRGVWEEIYLRVVRKIVGTTVGEVNSRTKVEAWGRELRGEMDGEGWKGLVEGVQGDKIFPKDRSVQDLVVNEAYCLIARYFHFQYNICMRNEEKPIQKDKPKENTKEKEKQGEVRSCQVMEEEGEVQDDLESASSDSLDNI